MGIIACYTGLLLWYLFLRLDSELYPVKTYADIGGRIFGKWFAYMTAILQSIQLIINVGTLQLSNGQSVSQISNRHVSAQGYVVSRLLIMASLSSVSRFAS